MAKEPLTPEERLLQVIDNPQAARPRALARLTRGAPFLGSVSLWVTTKLKSSRDGAQPLVTLRMINRILMVVAGVLAMAWVIDFASLRSQYHERLETVERTQLAAPTQAKSVSLPLLEFSDVLDQAKQRNIFTLVPPTPTAQAPVELTKDLLPYLSDLKLVGIIWSDNPQAMIEQSKEDKTSLVGKGEVIGRFRIKEIQKNKIILGPENGGSDQQWELQ